MRGPDGHRQRPHRGHPHHGDGPGGRRGRLFDYGELRLLVLALLADEPRHGYELMRSLEERTGGAYSPSPGVIYPTLSWLEDMGYARVETEGAGRKSYRATQEGESFLAANRDAVEALFARISGGAERHAGVPAPVLRGMENLKLALRLRLRRGPIDQATAETIAAALDAAAQAVERT
ncbi:PadR family transcriptional regulator [Methylobacterium durans]|uniref:PadR family transcriptional regulator n=1 Tax=Methylobacterium durans TaxID=2202825 RepID=UPI002AFF6731|nr:PadR family transcriptional regulator [Methylobacterium durans]MEA1832120.1 PadR family transcriptional regulator [Methylobacterium durans]